MVERVTLPVKYEVDWAGDGMFAHSLSDVTAAFRMINWEHGADEASNPSRPLMEAGNGRIALQGDEYTIEQSTVLTSEQLRARRRFRAMAGDPNPITVATGWIQNGQLQDAVTKLNVWEAEGLLFRAEFDDVSITQTSTTSDTTTTAIVDRLEAAFGLTTSQRQYSGTPLSSYTFIGRAGQYLSEFSRIAGVFPVEMREGGLGLFDPTHVPASPMTIDNRTYRMLGFETLTDSGQVRNRGIVRYGDAPGSLTGTATVDTQTSVAAANGGNDVTIDIDLPALTGGRTYKNAEISVGAGSGVVVTDRYTRNGLTITIAGSLFNPDGWGLATNADDDGSGLSPFEDCTVRLVSSTGGTGALQIAIPARNLGLTWNWTATQIAIGGSTSTLNQTSTGFYGGVNVFSGGSGNSSNPWPGSPPGPNTTMTALSSPLSGGIAIITRVLYGISLNYTINYEVSPATPEVIVNNAASQAVWGVRTLEFQPWFREGTMTGIEARIDELGRERRLHRVELPLAQRTEALARNVAAIDAGDYLALEVHDVISGIDIAEHVMVVSVQFSDSQLSTPTKVLTVIEAGTPVPPDLVYHESLANQVYHESTANPVEAR